MPEDEQGIGQYAVPDQPLSGVGVLVTRPTHQSEGLQRMLERLGAHVFQHALLRISPPLDPNAVQAALAEIEDSEVVIFASANAVRATVNMLPGVASRLQQPLIACLGTATSKALQGIGLTVDIMPDGGSTSEALLAVEEFSAVAIRDRLVSIIKGEGGRNVLANSLNERGAHVQLVNVYRREPSGEGIAQLLDDHCGDIDMVIVTSGESLARLHELAGIERVRKLPLVLPSDRVLAQAVELGFGGPFVVPRQVNDSELARAANSLMLGIRTAHEVEHE